MVDALHFFIQYIKTSKRKKFNSREELERWQESKVDKYINWVEQNSVFYKEHWKEHNLNDWKSFPTINKKIMMDNFNQLNTVNVNKEEAFEIAFKAENSRDFSPKLNNITIGLSSGTSGNRGLFVVSDKERAKWAGSVLAKTLPTSLFAKGNHKIAFFLRADSNLYQTVKRKKIQFEFFDLLDSVEEHIEKLNNYQPTILVAPASMLRMLAKEKENNQLKINPTKIISVAEVLDPLDEKHISKVFHQIIHQIYQCTEGFLATTCEKGNLHLNEDLVYIQKEYLDEDKTKFSPIITDFNRTSQPLVRYLLNDILTEKKEPCSCGSVFTAIEQIEGRSDDIFYFENTEQQLQPVFPDFIRRIIMSSSDKIEEYLVKQYSPFELEIAIKVDNDKNKEDIQKVIKNNLVSFIEGENLKVPDVNFVNYNLTITSKKLRRIERLFSE